MNDFEEQLDALYCTIEECGTFIDYYIGQDMTDKLRDLYRHIGGKRELWEKGDVNRA